VVGYDGSLLCCGDRRRSGRSRTLIDGSGTLIDGSRTLIDGSRTLIDGSRTLIDVVRSSFTIRRIDCVTHPILLQRDMTEVDDLDRP